jgi:hypothetical protein
MIKCIDNYDRRGFLWRRASQQKGETLFITMAESLSAARSGRLGDHRFTALRVRFACMRWLWQRRIDELRSWHELPDETEKVVEAMFTASIYIELGDSRKALFWSNR